MSKVNFNQKETSTFDSSLDVDEEQSVNLIDNTQTDQSNENLSSDFNFNEKKSFIKFNSDVVYRKCYEEKHLGEKYHLTFKFLKTETKLIKKILQGHGFEQVHALSSHFNILWTSTHIKPSIYKSLLSFQRVNHFPKSYELTRKDRLFKNIEKMQQEKGLRNFDFLPTTFLLPNQIQQFKNTFDKEKGIWIVKPIASSQGRGIYLINNADDLRKDENLIVSRYISNPLLIDGYKFDLRLYVAVTCYHPLVIYLYREGLTRLATVKYERNLSNISNNFMHLTNYSLNKKNHQYIRCDDPDIEDYGNKWTMSAMLRLLKSEGKDTFSLMMSIEDLIIKTFLSVQYQISNACQINLANKFNCFEVYGFDILIDEKLKPWLLEVNLSPSLSCDAPIDLKLKSHMICDLLNLSLLPCQNSYEYSNDDKRTKTDEISRLLKRFEKENETSGGFIRIFPTEDTYEYYSNYFHEKTLDFNQFLHQYFYRTKWKNRQLNNHLKFNSITRSKYLSHLFNQNSLCCSSELSHALQRFQLYQKRLNHQIYSNIIYPHQIIIQKSISDLNDEDKSEKQSQKRLLRVSSAPKQEYQTKFSNRKSRPISTISLIRKQMLTRLSSSKSIKTNQQPVNQDGFVEELTKLSTKQHQRQYTGRSQLSFLENECSINEEKKPIQDKDKEQVLEKTREIIEKNQIQNQQLAKQAKLFQEKFQRNQIYSAVHRYSRRPSIYQTLSNKSNQSKNNQTTSIFLHQHRVKSSH